MPRCGQRAVDHLIEQPHALDDIAAGAAEVDGLSAGPDARCQFDDHHAVAVAR